MNKLKKIIDYASKFILLLIIMFGCLVVYKAYFSERGFSHYAGREGYKLANYNPEEYGDVVLDLKIGEHNLAIPLGYFNVVPIQQDVTYSSLLVKVPEVVSLSREDIDKHLKGAWIKTGFVLVRPLNRDTSLEKILTSKFQDEQITFVHLDKMADDIEFAIGNQKFTDYEIFVRRHGSNITDVMNCKKTITSLCDVHFIYKNLLIEINFRRSELSKFFYMKENTKKLIDKFLKPVSKGE